MGGGLTFELIEDQISRPILDELANLKVSLDKRQVPLDDSNEPNAMPTFRWSSDTTPFPHLLPEDYIFPTTIHHPPLTMWKQWHHGASFQDGIAVGPLQNIETSNCPKRLHRSFQIMKKFFKELDKTSAVSGNENIGELGDILMRIIQNGKRWVFCCYLRRHRPNELVQGMRMGGAILRVSGRIWFI